MRSLEIINQALNNKKYFIFTLVIVLIILNSITLAKIQEARFIEAEKQCILKNSEN